MRKGRSLLIAALTVWAALIAWQYLMTHLRQVELARDGLRIWRLSPVRVERALAEMPGHLKAAGAMGAGVVVAWFAGGAVSGWFGGSSAPLRMALGLGTGSMAVLGGGLTGLLYPPLMISLACSLAVGCSIVGRKRRVRRGERQAAVARMIPSLAGRFIVLVAALSALINLLGALAPEVGYDSLIQHLADPLNYLREHRIYFNDLSFLAQHPAGVQMLYCWLMPLAGDRAAMLLHWFFGLLSAWAFWHWARRYWHEGDACVFGCVLYLTPFFGILSCRAYVDLGLVFFSCAALAAPWGSWLQGAMIGLAVCTKYSGGCLLVAWAGLLFFSQGSRAAWRVCVAAAVAGVWWGARNWLNTGNPLYPFFYSVLGGIGWGAQSAAEYQAEVTSYGWVSGWSGYLALPWLTFVRDRGALDDGSLGPLVLMTAPLLFMGGGRTQRRLGWLAAVLWAIYCISPRQVRYGLPYVPPTLGAVCLALKGLSGGVSRRTIRIVTIFLGALLFLQACVSLGAVYVWTNPYPVDLGAISRSRYLSLIMEPRDRMTGRSLYMKAAGLVRETLPLDARVYMLGDAKVHYMPGSWIVNALFNPPLLKRAVRESFGPEGVARKLRQRGVTHVLYNIGGSIHIEFTHHLFSFSDREFSVVETFFSRWLNRVWTLETSDGDPMYMLFRIEPGRHLLPSYLPGVDTRIAGVEEAVLKRDPRKAREDARGLLADYPSSRFLPGRLEAVLADAREGSVD